MTKRLLLVALVLLVPVPGRAQEQLWVGVLRQDGVAIPVAVHTDGSWTTPWPDVWYSRSSTDSEPPEPIGAPSNWTVYADSDPLAIQSTETLVVQAHCGFTWAQRTDWPDQVPMVPNRAVRIAGMIVSEPIELLTEESIPGIQSIRERNGLVSNGRTDNGILLVIPLGYFRLSTSVVGVFRYEGYEGEKYEVYEIRDDSAVLIASREGGGC